MGFTSARLPGRVWQKRPGPAYKDIDDVIEATERAGISKRVVRFIPIGNVKG